MTRTGRIVIIILFVLVLLSLGLNGFLIWQWLNFQRQAYSLVETTQRMLGQAIVELDAFQESTIEFQVKLDEEIPIQTEIPLNKTIEVPIETTIPITETVDTTVDVDIGQFGIRVPIDVSVPLDMEVPIDLQVPVRIEESFTISTSVPIRMNVPIALKVSETDLAAYLERLKENLEAIQKTLAELRP